MGWELKVNTSKNLLPQTYTPTPGSSCLFIKSLTHAASLLAVWMLPATRTTRTRLKLTEHWAPALAGEWNLPIVSADTSNVHRLSPKWQTTGHLCCLSNISASFPDHMSCEADRVSERENKIFPQTTNMAPKKQMSDGSAEEQWTEFCS